MQAFFLANTSVSRSVDATGHAMNFAETSGAQSGALSFSCMLLCSNVDSIAWNFGYLWYLLCGPNAKVHKILIAYQFDTERPNLGF